MEIKAKPDFPMYFHCANVSSMKRHRIQIAVIAVVALVALILLNNRNPDTDPMGESVADHPAPSIEPAPPESQPEQAIRPQEQIQVEVEVRESPPAVRFQPNVVGDRFDQQAERLNNETDPVERAQLIESLTEYVQVDTPRTIEWAMSLEDPDERYLAMEAINRNALTGIGAKLAVDATGYPKIRDTTPLSAIGSTGMVEPGDYIVGMMDESGQMISFHGMELPQIVGTLRGEAGTEVYLYMERPGSDGISTTSFEVPVRRSMLVILPPAQ
jgi:C-terminal processing protease CtpA/Prc